MLLRWQIYFNIFSGPQNFEILVILHLLFEGVLTTVVVRQICLDWVKSGWIGRTSKLVDSMLFSLRLHAKYISNPLSMLFYAVKVLLMAFPILFKFCVSKLLCIFTVTIINIKSKSFNDTLLYLLFKMACFKNQKCYYTLNHLNYIK